MTRSHWLVLVLTLVLVPAQVLQARYRTPDLVDVPVDQLIEKLQEQVCKNPKNAAAQHNLARAHAMAYARRTDTLTVQRDAEEQGVWFGYEPPHIPFDVAPTEDADKLNVARAHLDAAIKAYAVAAKLAPRDLVVALGHAWCVDQSGDKKRALREYRTVVRAASQREKHIDTHRPQAWPFVSGEAVGYLTALLDPQKDQKELARLAKLAERARFPAHGSSPIVVPLRDGLEASDLEDPTATVVFDADGSGLQRSWTWISPDAGWLVYDPRHAANITSALQLFGVVTFSMFWDNGYEPLSMLDRDDDGVLRNQELQGIAIWHDANGDGRCEAGEVSSLDQHGIVAISVRYQRDDTHPDRIAWSPGGVTLMDGSQRATYDILLQPR
ncbi:MAG TPA: hypothetical protein VF331_27560 [Polyangiales bacterium]